MDISKSDRKRRRRKIRNSAKYGGQADKYPSTRSRVRTKTKLPNLVEIEEEVPHIETSNPEPIERGFSAEEVLNCIEENIREIGVVTTVSTEENHTDNSVPMEEIYFADQIPQCTNTDIIVPFLTNTSSTACAQMGATIASQTGPNVIVEPVPCYLPTMDTFDETELNGLIDLNEQELIDHLLDGGTVEFM